MIGENGAGKSTLMKILMGMYRKDSGSLSVLGSDEAYTNPDQALKAGVAMIIKNSIRFRICLLLKIYFLGKKKENGSLRLKKSRKKSQKDIWICWESSGTVCTDERIKCF